MHEINPFYLQSGQHRLFSIYTTPKNDFSLDKTSAILFIPPLMDEMNKSRPLVSRQSKCFAEHGVPVLQFDLYGTGDSEGDAIDATLDIWKKNIIDAVSWLRRDSDIKITFWGLRAGCLLIFHLLDELSEFGDDLILWQPIFDGAQITKQIKRQLVAQNMSKSKSIEPNNENELVEVAGYSFNKRLFSQISSINFQTKDFSRIKKIFWANLSSIELASRNKMHSAIIDEWEKQGVSVNYRNLVGEHFWLTPEIYISQALLDSTTTSNT